jgi:hypothetical protein
MEASISTLPCINKFVRIADNPDGGRNLQRLVVNLHY